MIVQSLFPQDVRVRREAEALVRAGVSVDVICLRGPGQAEEEALGAAGSDTIGADIRVFRPLAASDKGSVAGYLALAVRFTLMAGWRLLGMHRRERYSLIQVHNMPDFLVFAALPQSLAGVPVVLDLHDLSVELFGSKWAGWKTRVLVPLVRVGERLSCGFANRLITTSTGFRDRLIARGVRPEKITLVMNTPDKAIFGFDAGRGFTPIGGGSEGDLQNGPLLLYHGTVQPRFGLDIAIRAVGELVNEMPGTTLTIHGNYDPDYRLELESLARELGLAENVRLLDFRPLEEIREIIRGSDIGLVPYRHDDFMNIALSTKTFEYAACGLPIVGSRLDSMLSIFSEDAVCLAEPGDPIDLAKKIRELCSDPERRRTQAAAAASALDDISWDVMAARYVGLIQDLLRGKTTGDEQ